MMAVVAANKADVVLQASAQVGVKLTPSNRSLLTGPDNNIPAVGLGLSPKKRQQLVNALSGMQGLHLQFVQ